MNASVYANISIALLPPGNYTINDKTTGQEELYLCLRQAGSELITQAYSTSQEGAWTIRIMLAVLAVKGASKLKRKKKKKRKIIGELTIPITIFSKKLGALESITKYLKENLGLAYSEIAGILSRDERTIWTAYQKAKEKQSETIEIKKTLVFIPTSILENRKLTILEAVIVYLKKQGLRYSEIAKLLDRDQRNIWTIYSRAVRKTKRKV